MGIASGQIIRVLLVSVRESTRDEVASALERRPHDYRLFWVAQPEVALARAQDLVPHVIIVDDDLGGTNAISLIGSLTPRVPSSAVLVLISPGAVGRANQAVLAGARGFLVKPLQTDELLTTMRFVLTQERAGRPASEAGGGRTGRLVAVCAPKGGTGRTTTSINTSFWLTRLSKQPVAMIDADYSSPALDVALNLHSDRSIMDLLPRIARLDADLLASVMEEHNSGMKVLLAPEPALMEQEITLPQVQQILYQMKRMFEWVVVDLGLPLNEMAFSFLDGADHIVMTVLPELVGLRNATLMLEQLRGRGYPDERIWLVINRATLRGGISREDIEQHLHMRVKHAIPDDQTLATYAVNRGVPLSMSHPNSAVAKSMRALADMLIQDANHRGGAPVEMAEEPKKAQITWPWTKRTPVEEHKFALDKGAEAHLGKASASGQLTLVGEPL